jgi:hypothetical protein
MEAAEERASHRISSGTPDLWAGAGFPLTAKIFFAVHNLPLNRVGYILTPCTLFYGWIIGVDT